MRFGTSNDKHPEVRQTPRLFSNGAPPRNLAKLDTDLKLITCFTMDWFQFRDLNTKPLDSTDYNNNQYSEERD